MHYNLFRVNIFTFLIFWRNMSFEQKHAYKALSPDQHELRCVVTTELEMHILDWITLVYPDKGESLETCVIH